LRSDAASVDRLGGGYDALFLEMCRQAVEDIRHGTREQGEAAAAFLDCPAVAGIAEACGVDHAGLMDRVRRSLSSPVDASKTCRAVADRLGAALRRIATAA